MVKSYLTGMKLHFFFDTSISHCGTLDSKGLLNWVGLYSLPLSTLSFISLLFLDKTGKQPVCVFLHKL